MAAEEQFTITYDGPAVTGGRMPVRELAPALLALSDALREAQHLTHPFEPEPVMDIQAMRQGSFAIDIVLTEGGLVQSAIDFLSGNESSAAVNLIELVGFTFGGFKLVKYLRKRRIRAQEALPDGTVRITFDDGTTLVVPSESVRLASFQPFRIAAREVVAPLLVEGVDSVELTSPRVEPVKVEVADVTAFELPPIGDQHLVDEVSTMALRPVSVAFTEGNKWRVSDGESTFYASITDQTFLNRVQSAQEVFSKSDILRARVRTRQWRTADGDLRTEHDIVDVLEHVLGTRDIRLPFEADPELKPPSPGISM